MQRSPSILQKYRHQHDREREGEREGERNRHDALVIYALYKESKDIGGIKDEIQRLQKGRYAGSYTVDTEQSRRYKCIF